MSTTCHFNINTGVEDVEILKIDKNFSLHNFFTDKKREEFLNTINGKKAEYAKRYFFDIYMGLTSGNINIEIKGFRSNSYYQKEVLSFFSEAINACTQHPAGIVHIC